MSTLYKRVTLVVANIERSLGIYRDILGFSVNSISESDADSYSYPVFNIPKEAKIRFATLDSPSQNRTLGLTEVSGCDLPNLAGIKMYASVIKIPNLDEAMQKIIELGLETTASTIDHAEDFSFKEQSFVDYDGHLIVLYENQEK